MTVVDEGLAGGEGVPEVEEGVKGWKIGGKERQLKGEAGVR